MLQGKPSSIQWSDWAAPNEVAPKQRTTEAVYTAQHVEHSAVAAHCKRQASHVMQT
jgi:hypothetical protein